MKSRLFITVLLALFTFGLSTGASAVSWTMSRAAYATGNNPASVAVADFNGDGIPDVAVADKLADGLIVVRLGKPGGKFTVQKITADGSRPVSMVAADFDEDGKMDLAVADSGTNSVRIYLGNGNGKFTLKHPVIPVGPDPVHLRAADLGNGHQDLVIACFGSKNVYVALGNGDGTFQAPVPYAVGTNPRHVCIADFNHDGIPDIAVTLWGDNKVATLLGSGGGAFDQSTLKTYPAGQNPLAVEAADLKGDGNIDLVFGDFTNDDVRILDGTAFGNFSTPPPGQAVRLLAPSGPEEIVLKDFDGDGHTDIAVAGSASNDISVFLGRGDGTFQARRVFPAGLTPAALASADIDRSGLPGLVSGDFVGENITVQRALTTAVGFWSYSTIPSASYMAGTAPSALLADDFDYDGVMDIAVANRGSNNISVLLNRKFRFGNMSGMFGNFSSAQNTPAPGVSFASLSTISAPSGIASGVFTNVSSASHPVGDFRAGIAVANSGIYNGAPTLSHASNTVAILLPAGDGKFILPGSAASPQRLFAGTAPLGQAPSAVKTADFNKDGKTDVAVCNQDDSPGTVTVYLGNGDGTFGDGKGKVVSQYGTTYTVGDGPVAMAVGDFNKDGILDIAVANSGKRSDGTIIGNGSVSILFGKGNGKFGNARTMLSGLVNPASIVATLGGNLVITEPNGTANGIATGLKNNGSGVFSVGKSFTVGVSPAGVLAEDVTDDRVVDIVTANSGSNDITLVQGLAVGGFSKTPVSFPAGTSPVALAAHDFNGDGATDLAVADAGDGTPLNPGGVTILFGRDIATLTVNINDPTMGSVTVQGKAGTQIAAAPSSVFQEEGGKQLKLTATANTGFEFVRWEGDLTGSISPDYLYMNTRTKTVTAVFRAVP
ncbi:MAG: FG-GAP-like repeat-containing protein [Nitrospirota bacterium]